MKLFLTILILLPFNVYAGNCDRLYPKELEIAIPNTVELCNSFFVNRYDLGHRAAIVSFELAKDAPTKIKRLNDFHPDIRIPQGDEGQNSDYSKTGYDKGHLTPAADSTTTTEMHDTFLLSNMTPQLPNINRLTWKNLEIDTRKKIHTYGSLHIATGALYDNFSKTIGKDRIPVPDAYYKILYTPTEECYYVTNVDGDQVKKTDCLELHKKIGF